MTSGSRRVLNHSPWEECLRIRVQGASPTTCFCSDASIIRQSLQSNCLKKRRVEVSEACLHIPLLHGRPALWSARISKSVYWVLVLLVMSWDVTLTIYLYKLTFEENLLSIAGLRIEWTENPQCILLLSLEALAFVILANSCFFFLINTEATNKRITKIDAKLLKTGTEIISLAFPSLINSTKTVGERVGEKLGNWVGAAVGQLVRHKNDFLLSHWSSFHRSPLEGFHLNQCTR